MALGISAAPMQATVLFSDTFEAYAPGSDLIGQGGWSAVPGPGLGSVIHVASGAFLPTGVLNGFDNSGSDGLIVFPEHSLAHALDPSAITTLSFDAYVTSFSHNSGIGLGNTFASVSPNWRQERNLGGWQFQTPGGYQVFPGGFDTPVKLAIIIDGVTNELYGRYDYGSGFVDTPHFTISDSEIAQIDVFDFIFNFRGTVGGEFDNIFVADNIVNSIPEPASLLLLSTGLAALVWRRRALARPKP